MNQKDIERFWNRVDVRGPDECWLVRSKSSYSYGAFRVDGKSVRGNRFAWLITHGDPGTQHVLHECDNPRCVNPRHLFLGTQSENMRDMARKKRHPVFRLDAERAREIRALFAAGGVTKAELARRFKVEWMSIHKVVRGESWA